MAADHDAIIRLQGQVLALTDTIAASTDTLTERLGRIEGKVDKINGKVADHVTQLALLEQRPQALSKEDQDDLRQKVEAMWSAFTFARWMAAIFLAEQSAGVALLIWWLNHR